MQTIAGGRTLALALLPRQSARGQALLVVGGAALVAVSAQVRIGLPFTPVPITGQTFAALLVGALLGSRLGAASLSVYALAGAGGLPAFANWGGGWSVASGPTGGYIVGFVAAAFLVGWFCERGWDRGYSVLVPLLAGNALIYLFGLCWLARFVGPERVLDAGLWPFLPGDLLKLAAASAALPGGWRAIESLRGR